MLAKGTASTHGATDPFGAVATSTNWNMKSSFRHELIKVHTCVASRLSQHLLRYCRK